MSFTVAVTDRDGDPDSDAHTITVTDGTDARSSGTAVLTVEESDLAGTGSTPSGTGETSVSTGLSFVTGTDAITLSFAASQSPVVNGLDETASMTWQRDAGDPSGRTLLGKIGGVTVITLTLTGDVTAAGGGDTARPTVTAVLSDNFPHQNAPDADSLTITGLVVNATDRDGEITTGTVNVTVVDDAPNVEVVAAVADGTPATDSVAEGGSLNGTWTLNDGADDVTSIRVSVAGEPTQVVALPGGTPAVFDLPAGVLTVNANGTWSFAAKISLDQTPSPPTVSFTVAVTDRDGDADSDAHTITVTDGADARSSGTAVLTVEESDLAGTGSTPSGTGETSVSTGLSFVTGTDAITLSFAASQSPVVNGLDETASMTWQRDAGDPSGRTLLGKIGGVTVITLTLTGDVTAAGGGDTARPTVTAVLSDNFPHQNAPDADSLTITGLVVNATDRDGEITTGTVNVTVVDDAPNVEVVAAVADGTPATDSVAEGGSLNGTWTLNDGADDVTSIRVSVAGEPTQVVALPGGTPAVFDLPAGVLTVNANGTWSFAAKISLDQTPSPPTVSFTVCGDGPRRRPGQ